SRRRLRRVASTTSTSTTAHGCAHRCRVKATTRRVACLVRGRATTKHLMTFLASIIIPCGPDHLHLLPRAVASAEAQTVACEVIPVIDHDRRGPGWARNRGAEQASGLFLVFLDADDELEASFVQTLARAYEP